MLRRLFSTLSVAVFAATVGVAQTNFSEATTNWGPEVLGVRLSIGLTNKVINAGSGVILFARINNASTNVVAIGIAFEPVYDYDVKLIDISAREHDPIPRQPIRMISGNRFVDVKPGHDFDTAIPIHNLRRDLKPGTYVFRAKRAFLLRADGGARGANRYELLSNLLEVRIE